MSNSQITADLIKKSAKSKKVSVSKLLSDCDLNKNALYTMQSEGFYPRVEALIKIADYLDCSIDYLLGRTDNAQSHKSANVVYGNLSNNSGIVGNVGSTISTTDTNPQVTALLEAFNKLDTFEQAKVLVFVDEFNKNK